MSCGGANFDGEAGTGKTEIIKGIDDICKENKKLYRWVKLFYKLVNPSNYYRECEDWRNSNPVKIMKLAPTNKACNNIGGKTFHRGLGVPFILDPDEDEEELIEHQEFDFMSRIIKKLEGDGKSKPRKDLIICDEISMISGEIWTVLASITLGVSKR